RVRATREDLEVAVLEGVRGQAGGFYKSRFRTRPTANGETSRSPPRRLLLPFPFPRGRTPLPGDETRRLRSRPGPACRRPRAGPLPAHGDESPGGTSLPCWN